MGAAPMAYVLWTRFLHHAPTRPDWFDRDRFVLSAGHASMLLYSLLHLTGYDLPLDELKRFRQLGSRTPGPSRVRPDARASRPPPARSARASPTRSAWPSPSVASRPSSTARATTSSTTGRTASAPTATSRRASRRRRPAWPATCKLGKLVFLYDDNHIQLDGPTTMAWSEDVLARFDAYGWHTQRVEDGNDLDAIEAAIAAARADDRPSLIAVRTHIGFGSPNRQDSQKAHGAPLGPDEVRLTKEAYGWDPDRTFFIPDAALAIFRRGGARGRARSSADWDARLDAYAAAYPEQAAELRRRIAGELPAGWDADLPAYADGAEALATRNVSQNVLQALKGVAAGAVRRRRGPVREQPHRPQGRGRVLARPRAGRNIRFGVREHAMGGIANGIAYHGGLLPYVATFLTFSDYMRGSVRLAALSGLHVVVRLDPRLDRPRRGRPDPPAGRALRGAAGHARADASCDRATPTRRSPRGGSPSSSAHGPVALALTRQKLPVLPGTAARARDGVARGGYVLADAVDADGHPTAARRHPHRDRVGAVARGRRRATS